MKRSRSGRVRGPIDSAADAAPLPPPTLGLADQQALVLRALRARAGVSATLAELADASGVTLVSNAPLLEALASNPRVLRDGEGRLRYAPVLERLARGGGGGALDAAALERIVRGGGGSGLDAGDVEDLYPAAARDLAALVRTGAILRVRSVDASLGDVLYSRDLVESTRVRLSGSVSVTPGSAVLRTTTDLTSELFRNDIILVGGEAFRVSSANDAPGGGVRRTGEGAVPLEEDDAADDVLVALPQQQGGSRGSSRRGSVCGAGGDAGGGGGDAAAAAAAAAGGSVKSGEDGGGAVVAAIAGGAAEGGAAAPPRPPPLLYPPTGVYTVSIGNAVKMTGGAFSAADTAPHLLRAPRVYAQPMTQHDVPLDRPWTRPPASGLPAYRFGCSGDLRVLWREIVTHDAVARQTAMHQAGVSGVSEGGAIAAKQGAGAAAASTAAGAGAAGVLTSTAVVDGAVAGAAAGAPVDSLLLYSLGGSKAFRDAPPFPATHRELRMEMRRVGLPLARMAPGAALDVSGAPRVPIEEGGDARARARARAARKPRALDARRLHLHSAQHLSADVLAEVQRHQLVVIKRQLGAIHAAHAQAHGR